MSDLFGYMNMIDENAQIFAESIGNYPKSDCVIVVFTMRYHVAKWLGKRSTYEIVHNQEEGYYDIIRNGAKQFRINDGTFCAYKYTNSQVYNSVKCSTLSNIHYYFDEEDVVQNVCTTENSSTLLSRQWKKWNQYGLTPDDKMELPSCDGLVTKLKGGFIAFGPNPFHFNVEKVYGTYIKIEGYQTPSKEKYNVLKWKRNMDVSKLTTPIYVYDSFGGRAAAQVAADIYSKLTGVTRFEAYTMVEDQFEEQRSLTFYNQDDFLFPTYLIKRLERESKEYKINVDHIRKIGGRSYQEDYLYDGRCDGVKNGKCTKKGKKNGLYFVFDGHGGDKTSKWLSENVSKYFRSRKINKNVEKNISYLQQFILDLDVTWFENHEEDQDGSTLTGCLITHTHIYLINLGDSRTILFENGSLIHKTVDHKPNMAKEKERIEKAGGFVISSGTPRVDGMLAVSRAIGDNQLKIRNLEDADAYDDAEYLEYNYEGFEPQPGEYMGRYAKVSSLPDIIAVPIKKNKKYDIYIGSDGVWDEISDMKVLYGKSSQEVWDEYLEPNKPSDNVTLMRVSFSS